jgi:hypothetical protein
MTAPARFGAGLNFRLVATESESDRQNMDQIPDTALLQSLARDSHMTFDQVLALFERERAALAREATVPNYITLLAVRRVRHQLLSSSQH